MSGEGTGLGINTIYIFLLFFVIHFIIPVKKFWPPYQGKATAAARAALPSPRSARWVFSCLRNPLNS